MLCFKQSIEILLIFSITFRCSLATFNFDFGNGNKIIIVEDAKGIVKKAV